MIYGYMLESNNSAGNTSYKDALSAIKEFNIEFDNFKKDYKLYICS